MSNQLIIIRDDINQKDKGSNQFTKALIKMCEKNNIQITVSDNLDKTNETTPTIVLEPNRLALKPYLSVDMEATANVVFNIINRQMNASSLLTREILIVGNGKTVGKPLRRMINSRTNWSVNYVDSKSSEMKKNVLIDDCEIIVLALPYGMKIDKSLKGKLVIDCSNSYDGIADYSVRDIGKLTVHEIIKNVLEC